MGGQHNQCCCEPGTPPPALNCDVPCLEVTLQGVANIPGCGRCRDCTSTNATYLLPPVGNNNPCRWESSYCNTQTSNHCGFGAVRVQVNDNQDGTYTVLGQIFGNGRSMSFSRKLFFPPDARLWNNLELESLFAGSDTAYGECDIRNAKMLVTARTTPCGYGSDCPPQPIQLGPPCGCLLCSNKYPGICDLLVRIPDAWSYSPLRQCAGHEAQCHQLSGDFILTAFEFQGGVCRWGYNFVPVGGVGNGLCYPLSIGAEISCFNDAAGRHCRLNLHLYHFGTYGIPPQPINNTFAGPQFRSGDLALIDPTCGVGGGIDCTLPGSRDVPTIIVGGTGWCVWPAGTPVTVFPIAP